MTKGLLVLAMLVAVAALGVASALADEAKTPVSATMSESIRTSEMGS